MPVRVFCGTWNVNGGPPAAGVDLRPWLTATGAPAGGGSRGGGRRGTHDLYMVAFQEVQPLSGRTAITTDTERGRRWEAAVGAALGGADAVTRIASRQLVGILLVVFASNALAPAVSNVLVTDAGVGLMRAAGNKGAVAARFVLYGTTSVAVVSCHLAAHDHATERRNEDYHQVLREAVFEEGGPRYENADWGTLRAAVNSGVTKARSKVRAAGAAYGPSGSSAFGGGSGGEDLYGPGVRLVEADALFWLGDLNYRIDLPADVVLDCIAKRDWPTLRDADQLTAARAMGAVFRGFSEGVLDFAPTYKHATHSDGGSPAASSPPPPVLVAVVEGDYPRTALGGSAAGLTADASPRGATPAIYPPEVRRLCDRLVEASRAALPSVSPRGSRVDTSPAAVADTLCLPPPRPLPSAVVTLLDAADTGRPFPPLSPPRDGRDGRDGRNGRDSRDSRDGRDSRDARDARDGSGRDDPFAAAAAAAGALYTLLTSLRPPLLPPSGSPTQGDAPSWAALHLVAAAAKRVAVDRARAARPGDGDAEMAAIRGAADAWR
ncbi:hypothetical protein I4F81_005317 [Pyropia yezoensis]|uniref:Uncharacterized protein n=1 Tax=Pyropia yezoensis TaxID=2788 RepID=A0ACC3BXZ4_PYRYE|nr:hypothetical protein I4F81_005317 [Neopyropia yezoensis]